MGLLGFRQTLLNISTAQAIQQLTFQISGKLQLLILGSFRSITPMVNFQSAPTLILLCCA
jgi:hypothetical protein